MFQKGLAPILIVFLIALAAGGVLYYQKSSPRQGYVGQAKPVTQTTKVDETANWKTYTSEKFGYQLKHPDLLLNKCNVGGISQSDKIDVVLAQGQPREGTGYCGSYIIAVFIDKNNKGSITDKLNEFISSKIEAYGGKKEDYVLSDSKLGTNSVVKLTSTNSFLTIYALSSSSSLYYFMIQDNTGGESKEEIDQILATFKFLDQK